MPSTKKKVKGQKKESIAEDFDAKLLDDVKAVNSLLDDHHLLANETESQQTDAHSVIRHLEKLLEEERMMKEKEEKAADAKIAKLERLVEEQKDKLHKLNDTDNTERIKMEKDLKDKAHEIVALESALKQKDEEIAKLLMKHKKGLERSNHKMQKMNDENKALMMKYSRYIWLWSMLNNTVC